MSLISISTAWSSQHKTCGPVAQIGEQSWFGWFFWETPIKSVAFFRLVKTCPPVDITCVTWTLSDHMTCGIMALLVGQPWYGWIVWERPPNKCRIFLSGENLCPCQYHLPEVLRLPLTLLDHRTCGLGMDGLFERDLPVSVALAGVTAQGPVQPI